MKATDGPKQKSPSSIRLNEKEEEMLKELVETYGFTRTNVFKVGLHLLYNKLTKKETPKL